MVGDLFIVVPDEISPPFISTLLRTGEVSVLLVSVCDPVSVATVLSIEKVTVLLLPLVSIPVPPVSVSVSLSKSIFNAPPESAWKSRSCAVIVASTKALIDCCVANLVALLLEKSSSSRTPVTDAPPAVKVSPANFVVREVALLDVVGNHLTLAWS